MPITPPSATIAIAGGLASFLHIGPGAIKLAAAIAAGLDQWVHGVPVITTDTGTAGAGASTIPLTIPPPALQAGLAVGFAEQQIIGPMSPLTILGLSAGISAGLAQGSVIATHPGVVGACIVSFGPFSAIPPMLQGFQSQNMTQIGSIKMANAIGKGLDLAFSIFTMPCPIPGAPGPAPATGKGFGFVL